MKVVVFDTQALLILYLDEQSAKKVEDYLTLVSQGKIKGYMNVVNLAELYYILSRIDKSLAEEKERNVRSYGVKLIFDNSKLWKLAALIKADRALSLADAFAAATAIHFKATLVTGADEEFDGIGKLSLEHL